MTNQNIEGFTNGRQRGFRLATFLPKRKSWIQTLILLPFGLPVANFLGASWHFSVNAIVEEHQYVIGILSMAINLLLPSLFFAFIFHWGWFVWHQSPARWYPHLPALGAGFTATMTIAISFGLVELFTHSLGICSHPVWSSLSATLLCNLDGYSFEAKSWFGAWFIVAAYCDRVRDAIDLRRYRFIRRNLALREDLSDYGAVSTTHGDLPTHDTPIAPIATHAPD